MATKKAPPRRNTDVIRCENCGEEYSTTYKRCPFCDERPGGQGRAPVGGRRVSGGGRSRRPNPMQIAGLVISLALIITAVVIVFTSLAPMIFHKTPSGDASGSGQSSSSQGVQGAEVTLNGLTLSRTEVALQVGEPYQLIATTDPADAQVTVEWTSSDTDVATVDQFGNVTNVYRGSDTVSVTITAAAGGQTAQCTVQCTGDGSGANIAPSGSGQEEALTGLKIPRFSLKDSVFASTVENVSASAGTLQCFCEREQNKSVKTVYFAGVQPLASRHEKRYNLRST